MDFWLLDLGSGPMCPLTSRKPGFDRKSFDVSADGQQIPFDRFRVTQNAS